MVLREGVPSLDATKVWNFDSLRCSHFLIISGLWAEYLIYLRSTADFGGEKGRQYARGVSRVSPSILRMEHANPETCATPSVFHPKLAIDLQLTVLWSRLGRRFVRVCLA